MTPNEKKNLQIAACKVRQGIVESTYCAKCGHPGGSLSAADMFTYLYNKDKLPSIYVECNRWTCKSSGSKQRNC